MNSDNLSLFNSKIVRVLFGLLFCLDLSAVEINRKASLSQQLDAAVQDIHVRLSSLDLQSQNILAKFDFEIQGNRKDISFELVQKRMKENMKLRRELIAQKEFFERLKNDVLSASSIQDEAVFVQGRLSQYILLEMGVGTATSSSADEWTDFYLHLKFFLVSQKILAKDIVDGIRGYVGRSSVLSSHSLAQSLDEPAYSNGSEFSNSSGKSLEDVIENLPEPESSDSDSESGSTP